VALRVKAATLEELFRLAASGLAGLLADTDNARATRRRPFEVSGLDLEELLVSWLTELLLQAQEAGHLWVHAEELTIWPDAGEWRLRAVCAGEPLDTERCPRRADIKAVTYHGLAIDPEAVGGYDVLIVFDT